MRGHGIHSPLAYRLVTTVIRGHEDYYAYPHLDAIARREGVSRARLRLIFRLVCEFAPLAVSIDRTLSPAVREAITAADSRIRLTGGDATMRILATMPAVLPDSGVTIALHGGAGDHLHTQREHGMLFTDGDMVLAVMRHDLPAQDFDIIFPR